jgi:hypothetical protein
MFKLFSLLFLLSFLFSSNIKTGDVFLTYSKLPTSFFIAQFLSDVDNSTENYSHTWVVYLPENKKTINNIYSFSFSNLAEKGHVLFSSISKEKNFSTNSIILRPKIKNRQCFDDFFHDNVFNSKTPLEFDWAFKPNNKFYCFEFAVEMYQKCFPEALNKKKSRLDSFNRFNLDFFDVERFHTL